jgi:predicted DNA-binding transcriptional regulator
VHVFLDHQPADEFETRFAIVTDTVKAVFMRGSYADVYGWLQYVLQAGPPPGFAKDIDKILSVCPGRS